MRSELLWKKKEKLLSNKKSTSKTIKNDISLKSKEESEDDEEVKVSEEEKVSEEVKQVQD